MVDLNVAKEMKSKVLPRSGRSLTTEPDLLHPSTMGEEVMRSQSKVALGDKVALKAAEELKARAKALSRRAVVLPHLRHLERELRSRNAVAPLVPTSKMCASPRGSLRVDFSHHKVCPGGSLLRIPASVIRPTTAPSAPSSS